MDHQSLYLALDEAVLEPIVREWRGQYANGGILALVPEAQAGRIPVLQAVCREAGMPVAGGVFPALLEQGREVRNGVRLVSSRTGRVILTRGWTIPAAWLRMNRRSPTWSRSAATEQPLLFTMYDSTLGTLGALCPSACV